VEVDLKENVYYFFSSISYYFVYTYSLLLDVSPGTWVASFNMNCTLWHGVTPFREADPAILGGFDESIELTAESSFSTPDADELPLSVAM